MRRAEDPNRGLGGGGMAEWKEGALFPEGWDSMPLPKKVLWQPPSCHGQVLLVFGESYHETS